MADLFHSGLFTVTLGGVSVGQTQGGFEIESDLAWNPITGDNMGDSVQDGVWRGGNCFLSTRLNKFDMANSAIINALWGIHASVWGQIDLTKIGTLVSAVAFALVLTRAQGQGPPATLTASKAVLAPGNAVRQLMAPELRVVPVRFQLLPFVDTNTYHFKVT